MTSPMEQYEDEQRAENRQRLVWFIEQLNPNEILSTPAGPPPEYLGHSIRVSALQDLIQDYKALKDAA